ncbi:MAG: hypothetical protein AABY30_01775 [Candidatus Thermoplasmatota archaeon]
MVPVSRTLRLLMLIVIAVSVPEGLALLFGPPAWYTSIWGWSLTPMTARFTAGVYLSVAVGFALAFRETDWDRVRIPLAMLWSFALIALLAAVATNLTSATTPFRIERPFSWVWIFLYVISVAGGLYYQFIYPRKFGAKPW